MPTLLRTTVIVALAALFAVACDDAGDVEADLGEATPEPTATETVTVTETVTETVTPTPGPTGEATEQGELRDLIVAPQQPQRVDPGSDAEFSVTGRLGGGGLPELVGFGWTLCEEVDATESSELTFVDRDGDGHADAMGESNTGAARLDTVNGERFENVDDEWPTALHTQEEEPPLRFTMSADAPDCATVVVFLDEDGDEELDLDDDRSPVEVYGVGEVAWRD